MSYYWSDKIFIIDELQHCEVTTKNQQSFEAYILIDLLGHKQKEGWIVDSWKKKEMEK